MFELGGYAFLWCDPSVAAKAEHAKLSYYFPSVDEAYLRAGWKQNDLVIGVRKGELVVSAGGIPVLIEPMDWREPKSGIHVESVKDDGRLTVIRGTNSSGQVLTVEMHRPNRLIIRKRLSENWEWWCQGQPVSKGDTVRWDGKARLGVTAGTLSKWDPAGYKPALSVGFGKLKMRDPAARSFPLCAIQPDKSGEIVIEVKHE